MSVYFHVKIREQNGDLYVEPQGDLDGSSAWELINQLYEHYDGKGNVFIDTRHINEICPFGSNTFRCRLDPHRLPASRLFFKGIKGHDMAPKGSNIITSDSKPVCSCDGQCENCLCSGKARQN